MQRKDAVLSVEPIFEPHIKTILIYSFARLIYSLLRFSNVARLKGPINSSPKEE
jgi:hypothetical protein